MLSVSNKPIKLSVVLLNVVMPSVIMLSVVAPKYTHGESKHALPEHCMH
jgi:hypothetical protein